MPNSEVNIPAILRGEQRSTRFQYRHTLAGAAREIGIPTGWVWFWLLTGRLRSQKWLRCIWVRLENVQGLFHDLKAVQDAFYATGEPLSSTAVRQALSRWPDLPKDMYLPETPKRPVASVITFPAREKEVR